VNTFKPVAPAAAMLALAACARARQNQSSATSNRTGPDGVLDIHADNRR